MRNFRFVTNANAFPSPVTAQTRTYTGPLSTFLDVPEIDAPMLRSNGWVQLIPVGPSATRPDNTAALNANLRIFIDTDLNKVICFDGIAWRDPLTGAIV